MGVDCSPVAGIGLTLEGIKWPDELMKLYEEEFEEEDGYIKDADSFGDDEYLLDRFLEGTSIYYAKSGSYFSGETTLHLFAEDPINGLDTFISDMQTLGFEITREDLEFISETLWW